LAPFRSFIDNFVTQVRCQHAESFSGRRNFDDALWHEAGAVVLVLMRLPIVDEHRTLSQAGLVTGAATLAILSYVSVSCMLMIVECKNQILQEVGRSKTTRDADELSFGRMADELLGPRGKFWADFTVVFTQLAFGTAYIIYAGSNCSLVAQTYGVSLSFIGLDSAVLLMILAGAAVSPFVLLR
jgi:amino acid permease